MQPYSVFFRMEAIEAARALRRQDREKILRFARSLADNPFQNSDSREFDGRGRLRHIKIVENQAVVYYVDNADQEIRILDVRPTDA